MTLALVEQPIRYRAWTPTARQEIEPDTTYLMDLDVEAAVPVAEGRMMGANEVYGDATDKPPWLGGSKVAVVAGKYRDGLHGLNPSNGFLHLPIEIPTDQFTVECFAKSAVGWNSLSNATVLRLYIDGDEQIGVLVNAGFIAAFYYHQHDTTGQLVKTFNDAGHAVASGTWVSIALTLLSGTLKLYVDGVAVGQVTGCTAPALWGDPWASGTGLAVGIDSNLTVSDVRLSRLARVPGVVPS